MLREIKDRVLGIPWIYDVLRPLAAGGIDFAALAAFCAIRPDERVFDLGCGTGQLLPYLKFGAYLGVDLDPSVLRRAARHTAPNVRFVEGDHWDELYRELKPDVSLMIGVVHHLSDEAFRLLAGRMLASESLRRMVAVEVTCVPGRWLNNLLSRLDRGGFVREPAGYERLFERSGLRVVRREMLPTKLRYVLYVGYHLEPVRCP